MNWLELLPGTHPPLLPEPLAARLYLALGWGLVLACAGAWLVRRLLPTHPSWAWGAALGLLLWSLWPGPVAPSHWLGLAFRTPSLASAALCVFWLWRQYQGGPGRPSDGAVLYAQTLGVALGWLLLLDTFAVWPISLYALGFHPLSLGVVAVVAGLPWVRQGARAASWVWGASGVLLLFVLLRLPSGNLWDALLDPWLWAGLHVALARHLWLKARRVPAATRA